MGKDDFKKIKDELKGNALANVLCHSMFDSVLIAYRGRIICCNDNLLNVSGYNEEELGGKKLNFLFTGSETSNVSRIFTSPSGRIHDIAGIKKDGVVFHGKIKVKNIVYNSANMKIAVLKDLTVEKKNRRMIKESEDRYRILTESMLDGIIIVDCDGRIFYANHASVQMFGYRDGKEMMGKSIFDFMVDGFTDKAKRDLKLVFADKGGFLVEYHVKDKSGISFWVEAIGQKTNFEGRLVDLICLRDVTERKLAEESLKKYLNKTRRMLDEIVLALSKTIGEKDSYTAAHQHRVARLACSIAREMNLSMDIINGLRIASILHDIGKIYIPAEILAAPRKLNDIEMELVKYHPLKGNDILEKIEFPWPVAKIILQHHERLDGKGYPNHVQGNEVLLESKILAVADVVEAMSSHRPYRSSLGVAAALKEIKQNKGVLYADDVVEACLRVFVKGFVFER